MAGRAASTAADRAASITTNTNIHRVNTAADLARLRDEGTHLNPQELKELKARLRSLEEMAKFEDRFRLLERRERPHSNEDPDISEDVENVRNLRAPTDDDNSGTGNVTNYSLTRPPTELHASDPSSSESDDQRRHKRLINADTNDGDIIKGLRLPLVIPSEQTLALGNGATGKEISKECSKGTPTLISMGPRKFSKPSTTSTRT